MCWSAATVNTLPNLSHPRTVLLLVYVVQGLRPLIPANTPVDYKLLMEK
jgi:hypothetical protein